MLNIKFSYAIVFISLACWAVYAYLTTTEIIQSQNKYAHIINISGKQRMLSQKTTLIAKRFYETNNQEFKTHLIELYDLMKQDHNEIVSQYLTFEQAAAIYHSPGDLKNKIDHYLILLSSFIHNGDRKTLQQIEKISFELLPQINNAVYVFESESNEKTKDLMERELFILIGTLFTLIFEALLIVIPVIRVSLRKDSELRQLVAGRTRELEALSVTDQLTKLYNRRKIDSILTSEVEQARRYHHSFSLILIDVDNFKKVNDTYGHQTGDRVLQTISTLFSSSVRKSDLVGRWGGEEFLIVSLEEDLEKVLVFSEKLRSLVESQHFDRVGNVTCSFGVAHYVQGDTVDSLLSRTDVALYDAKAAGRNCIKVISS